MGEVAFEANASDWVYFRERSSPCGINSYGRVRNGVVGGSLAKSKVSAKKLIDLLFFAYLIGSSAIELRLYGSFVTITNLHNLHLL